MGIGPYRGSDIVMEPVFAVRGTCETSTGAVICVEATVTCLLRFGGLPIEKVQPVLRRSVVEHVKKTIRKLHPTQMTDLDAVYLLNRTVAEADGAIFRCPISDRMEKKQMKEMARDLRYFKRAAERASDLVSSKETIQSKIKTAEEHLVLCFSCRTEYHEWLARTQNKKITEFREGLTMPIFHVSQLLGGHVI